MTNDLSRRVYVISDLHLGGREPDELDASGFRMMRHQAHLAAFVRALAARPPRVELVINGDFVDFLAEQLPDETGWTAFRAEPGEALRVFEQVLARPSDRPVFDALAELLAAGHDLTVMLGNHDLELALPEVGARFERAIGALGARGNLRWVRHNEAYLVGDALVEHGNRYDAANVVDHDRLRGLCSLRSRWQFAQESRAEFHPPPGSVFVAELMNPLKRQLPFIDLLKPESEPLFALVLALRPDARDRILELIRFAQRKSKITFEDAATPSERAHVSAVVRDVVTAAQGDSLGLMLDALGVHGDERAEFFASLTAPDADLERAAISDRVGGGRGATEALTALAVGGGWIPRTMRMALVRRALRALGGDHTFDRGVEPNGPILAAAEALTTPRTAAELGTMPANVGRLGWVVFGHTHHAKSVTLSTGATYLNTGTWARLMRFPNALLDDDDQARAALDAFARRLDDGDLDGLVEFTPTYVRIDVDATGDRATAALYDYDWQRDALTDPA